MKKRHIEVTLIAASTPAREAELELYRAMREHAPMHSAHEGISVIREEFEELWAHVKADTGSSLEAREEALQLAAMALRYVVDVCDGGRARLEDASPSTRAES